MRVLCTYSSRERWAAGSERSEADAAQQLGVVRVDFRNGVDATDGTVDSLRALNQTLSLQLRPRYDDVTGVGSPKGAAYVFGV